MWQNVSLAFKVPAPTEAFAPILFRYVSLEYWTNVLPSFAHMFNFFLFLMNLFFWLCQIFLRTVRGVERGVSLENSEPRFLCDAIQCYSIIIQ